MEIIMGMYNKFINLKKASCIELFLEYSSWIFFLFPDPPKLLPFNFPSQTCFLWTYLLPLTNGDWKQNVFQLKLAIMTCFLNQRACPRCSGGKESSESFKCNWSTGTVSHNGSPKENPKILFHVIAPYFLNTFILGSKHRAVRTCVFYFVKFNSLKIIHVSSPILTFIFFLVLLFNPCEQFVSPLNRLSVNLVPLVPKGSACS